jgi:hypothetical protein
MDEWMALNLVPHLDLRKDKKMAAKMVDWTELL